MTNYLIPVYVADNPAMQDSLSQPYRERDSEIAVPPDMTDERVIAALNDWEQIGTPAALHEWRVLRRESMAGSPEIVVRQLPTWADADAVGAAW